MAGAAVLRTIPEGPCEARLFVACAAVRVSRKCADDVFREPAKCEACRRRIGKSLAGHADQGCIAGLKARHLRCTALQRGEVSAAERMIKPLDRPYVPELSRYGRTIGANQVDLRIERGSTSHLRSLPLAKGGPQPPRRASLMTGSTARPRHDVHLRLINAPAAVVRPRLLKS